MRAFFRDTTSQILGACVLLLLVAYYVNIFTHLDPTRRVFSFIWWDAAKYGHWIFPWGIEDLDVKFGLTAFERFLYIGFPLLGSLTLFLKGIIIVTLVRVVREQFNKQGKCT